VEGGSYVGNLGSGSYLLFQPVNLTGMQSFTARVASGSTQALTLQIHLDSAAGTLIGTCTVPPTGGAQSWTTVTCSLTPATGSHNIYLVFPTSGVDLEWFAFGPNALTAQLVPGATVSLDSMASGYFLDSGSNGQALLTDSATVGTSQQFKVVSAGNGNIALLSQATGLFVTADPAGVKPLSATGASLGSAQTFTEVDLGESNIALLSAANTLYVTVNAANSNQVYNQAASVTPAATFTVQTY
jgi:hypothetical protein